MRLKAIQDAIFLEKFEMEQKTQGGIIVPETVVREQHIFRVAAIGNGVCGYKDERLMFVKVGDVVVTHGCYYEDSAIEIDGKKYHVAYPSDIVGVIEEK